MMVTQYYDDHYRSMINNFATARFQQQDTAHFACQRLKVTLIPILMTLPAQKTNILKRQKCTSGMNSRLLENKIIDD